MKRIYYLIARCRHILCIKWVKWPLIITLTLAVTATHLIMYYKYRNSPSSPSWEFTLALHSGMALITILTIVIYKKYIKRKLLEYGTKN